VALLSFRRTISRPPTSGKLFLNLAGSSGAFFDKVPATCYPIDNPRPFSGLLFPPDHEDFFRMLTAWYAFSWCTTFHRIPPGRVVYPLNRRSVMQCSIGSEDCETLAFFFRTSVLFGEFLCDYCAFNDVRSPEKDKVCRSAKRAGSGPLPGASTSFFFESLKLISLDFFFPQIGFPG